MQMKTVPYLKPVFTSIPLNSSGVLNIFMFVYNSMFGEI